MALATTRTMRAALYERVSSEEQVEGYSLDAQDRAGRAYCAAHGWEVAKVYRDEGRSARTDDLAKRLAFQQLLADAEAGLLDVVVVHKLDRFARNLRVTLETLERLEQAGVGFGSISEQMDFTTPIGKVILATLAAFAQYYSDNLAGEVRKGKAERKAQGLYNGVVPFGATRGGDGVPVPDTSPRWVAPDGTPRSPAEGLLLAFELAAEGKTHREIAQALTAAGYRTTGNRGENPFTKDSVRVLLANRFYLGELPDGEGGWLPGKHASMGAPDLFGRAQAMRDRNTSRPRRVSTIRTPWALSGVATCGDCGEPLVLFGSGPRRRVQCSGRRQGNGCGAPTFFVEAVEEQVGALLDGFAVPSAAHDRLLNAWRRGRSRHVDANAERLRLRKKLDRLAELYVEGAVERGGLRQLARGGPGGVGRAAGRHGPGRRGGADPGGLPAQPGGEVAGGDAGGAQPDGAAPVRRGLGGQQGGRGSGASPEFRPFLELADAGAAVREGLSTEMSLRRKRRGSVTRVHPAGAGPDRRLPIGSLSLEGRVA
jgi:site-specific DNA recombinase